MKNIQFQGFPYITSPGYYSKVENKDPVEPPCMVCTHPDPVLLSHVEKMRVSTPVPNVILIPSELTQNYYGKKLPEPDSKDDATTTKASSVEGHKVIMMEKEECDEDLPFSSSSSKDKGYLLDQYSVLGITPTNSLKNFGVRVLAAILFVVLVFALWRTMVLLLGPDGADIVDE